MSNKVSFIVQTLGTLTDYDDYSKFSFRIPSYAKQLIGIALYSPELGSIQATDEQMHNVELSLQINNKKQLSNVPFKLQNYENEGANNTAAPSRLVELNQPLEANQMVSGYVQNVQAVTSGGSTVSFTVKLILKCLK